MSRVRVRDIWTRLASGNPIPLEEELDSYPDASVTLAKPAGLVVHGLTLLAEEPNHDIGQSLPIWRSVYVREGDGLVHQLHWMRSWLDDPSFSVEEDLGEGGRGRSARERPLWILEIHLHQGGK